MKAIKIFYLLILAINIGNCISSKINVEQYRLPNTSIPLHYDVRIQTELDANNFVFDGEVTIKIDVLQETNTVAVHTKNSTIKSVDFDGYEIQNKSLNEVTNIYTIELKEVVKKGQHQLKITYESVLRDDKMGFYRSSYKDDSGKKVWVAATQFAPVEARHAFPCFDEPKFKASFKLQIVHPKRLFTLSNTEMESKQDVGDTLSITTFKVTPKMSTYLVAFVISDFARIQPDTIRSENNIAHSTYVRSNAVSLGKFSAAFGANAYNELYNQFGGSTGQPKEITEIKQILLPDFHFSGMENWGAITYNEQKLFYDPKIHTTKQLYNILQLMAHEMTHQWFGNSITHEWWTYVWLKEGFSTLWAYYTANELQPLWHVMQMFQTNVLHFVFNFDEDPTIRPMSFYVEEQKAILKNYDRIAYEKSACVLRMLDNALGGNIFKQGVDIFLENRKLNSATEDDLFKALSKTLEKNGTSTIDITETFGNWTHQGGYPLVTIEVKKQHITLQQERFLTAESFGAAEFAHLVWHIPINLEMPQPIGNNFTDTKSQFWFKSSVMHWDIDQKAFNNSKHWIIANVQQTGYYRVNYNKENWQRIIETMNSNLTEIHVANRAQLIDDAYHLAKVGRLDYEIVFDLSEYLSNETTYAPWKAFADGFGHLKNRILSSENATIARNMWSVLNHITAEPFKKFAANFATSEIPSLTQTRQIIVGLACAANQTHCNLVTQPYNTPELRRIYYCQKIKEDGNDTTIYNEVKQLIKTQLSAKIVPLKSDYLSALGCTTNENLLQVLLLQLIKEKDNDMNLSKNERSELLHSIISNSRVGLRLAMKFITTTWTKLEKSLCEGCLGKAIVAMSEHIHNAADRNLFNELLGAVNVSAADVDKAAQNVINNVEWNAQYMEKIGSILSKKVSAYNSSGIVTSFIGLQLISLGILLTQLFY